MTEVKGLIVHLERAVSRRAQAERLLQKLPFETMIVKAVDGASLGKSNEEHYERRLVQPYYPFALREAEIATFLSHRTCWQTIIDQDFDAALILEDDVMLEEPFFSQALGSAMSHIVQGDVVRFPTKMREVPTQILSQDGEPRVMIPQVIGLGMQAQIVTRGAARKLLEKTQKFDRPVDTFLQLQWVHEVRVLTVVPSGICEISAELGGSLIGRRVGPWERLRREVRRPLYRRSLSKHLQINR